MSSFKIALLSRQNEFSEKAQFKRDTIIPSSILFYLTTPIPILSTH